jgi:hypothetical protein
MTSVPSVVAVFAQSYQIRFGRCTTIGKCTDMVYLFAGLTTRNTVDASSTLSVVPLEDFLADIPPRDLRVGIRVAVATDLLHTSEQGLGCRSTKHKIVPMMSDQRFGFVFASLSNC